MPSAFISPMASPLAFFFCAINTGMGLSSTASITEITCRWYSGSSRSSARITSTANGASGWFRAKSSCTASVMRQPRSPGPASGIFTSTPASSSPRVIEIARRESRRRVLASEWLSCISAFMRAHGSPGPSTTLRIIDSLTRIRDCNCSGSAACNFSKVSSDQLTNPSGAFLRCTFLSFLGSSPALASNLAFSISCSGA